MMAAPRRGHGQNVYPKKANQNDKYLENDDVKKQYLLNSISIDQTRAFGGPTPDGGLSSNTENPSMYDVYNLSQQQNLNAIQGKPGLQLQVQFPHQLAQQQMQAPQVQQNPNQ
jgi:hypothetical protein